MWDKVVRNVLQAAGLVSMIIVFHTLLMSGVCPATSYSSSEDIDPGFRVAVSESTRPALITWQQYQQNPTEFADRLMRAPDVDAVKSESGDVRVTREGDVITVFDLATDSNRSWSSYRINGDRVEPVSFKLPQRFYVYTIFLAALMYWLLKILFERWRSRSR